MRLAYLDEAGVSNPKHEPYMVVAGFILNGDQDWQPLAAHLRAIARKYLPDSDRYRFVFHAKDIWHGSGYFDRKQWPLPVRTRILLEIASIPRTFHLPVVAGFIDRLQAIKGYRSRNPNMPDQRIFNLIHAEAYVDALEDVNFWARRNAYNEVAMIIAENSAQTKVAIKLIHNELANDEEEFWYHRGAIRVKNFYPIVDTVHFAEKHESALLSIADTCAFVIKRHLMGKTNIVSHFEALRPQIVSSRDLSWIHPLAGSPP